MLHAFGLTQKGPIAGTAVPTTVFINVRKTVAHRATLLHEMIHATSPLDKDHKDPHPGSVFSPFGGDFLPEIHAAELANCFFSTILIP